jgi:hypothetical protein
MEKDLKQAKKIGISKIFFEDFFRFSISRRKEPLKEWQNGH